MDSFEKGLLTIKNSMEELIELTNKVHKEEIEYLKHCIAYEKVMNERGWNYRNLRN